MIRIPEPGPVDGPDGPIYDIIPEPAPVDGPRRYPIGLLANIVIMEKPLDGDPQPSPDEDKKLAA